MSFLGNDFIPHGLTLCIREDGIDRLMEILEGAGKPLVILNDSCWSYNLETLKYVIDYVSKMENKWLLSGMVKKLKMSSHGYPKPGSEPPSDVEKALTIMNALPLTWKVERCITTRTEAGVSLNDDWKEGYYENFLWGAKPEDTVKEWLKGIQWVLNYYTGSKPVDFLWYYPWYLPPLYQDIAVDANAFVDESDCNCVNPIEPLSQLIMVLPIESYALLPTDKRRLPFLRPEYYPKKWTFFSAGRRQLWECEPMIPMLPYHVVAKFNKMLT